MISKIKEESIRRFASFAIQDCSMIKIDRVQL